MSEAQKPEKVVLARKSYEHLIRTRDRALQEAMWAQDQIRSTERWARDAFDEQRRLSERLTAVVAAAASLGVSIEAINDALGVVFPGEGTDRHRPDPEPVE